MTQMAECVTSKDDIPNPLQAAFDDLLGVVKPQSGT
jgi:hypothetical protein